MTRVAVGILMLGWALLAGYPVTAFSVSASDAREVPPPVASAGPVLREEQPGEGCSYWQKHLKRIIKKQTYPYDYKDNYVVTRGRKLVIQGYVELVKACALGSAARAEIFKHICDLSVQLVREAEPDVLAMTMTQMTAGGWERISLHQFNEHIQAAYCRPVPRYPLMVGH